MVESISLIQFLNETHSVGFHFEPRMAVEVERTQAITVKVKAIKMYSFKKGGTAGLTLVPCFSEQGTGVFFVGKNRPATPN